MTSATSSGACSCSVTSRRRRARDAGCIGVSNEDCLSSINRSYTMTNDPQSDLDTLEPIVAEVVAPSPVDINTTGAYPRRALRALGKARALGLVSACDGVGRGLA